MADDWYKRWSDAYERLRTQKAEERIRWLVRHECKCGTAERGTPAGHWWNCPLVNPDDEMWLFHEGDGVFVLPLPIDVT